MPDAPFGPDALLAGKRALITGASSGIGAEMTRRLLGHGARVALVGRSVDRLRPVAAGAPDGATMLLACDVRDDAAVRATVDAVEREWGGVDLLINSAGVFKVVRLQEMTNEDWDELWQINVNGTVYATRAVLPGMLERGDGIIMTLSSIAAHRAFSHTTGYAASKHAVTGFARALSTEVRRKGVKVVNAFIGPVDTPIWDGLETPLEREEMLTVQEVGNALINAITISPRQVLEDVLILPQRGIYY
jgi:NADP-dependent 3-hydroxy acid dehydrogenase YdfG